MPASGESSSPLFQARDLLLSASPLAGPRHQLRLHAGEPVALRGQSGAGKSSLLRALVGLSPFQDGSLEVRGRGFEDWGPAPFRGQVMGLPQGGGRPLGRVSQWVTAVEEMRGPSAQAPLDWREEAAALDLPEDVGERSCEALSQGEWQRLLVALALSLDPAALLLDEPFAALDGPRARTMIQRLLRWCADQQRGLLIASHEHPAWDDVADRVIRIQQGLLVEGSS